MIPFNRSIGEDLLLGSCVEYHLYHSVKAGQISFLALVNLMLKIPRIGPLTCSSVRLDSI